MTEVIKGQETGQPASQKSEPHTPTETETYMQGEKDKAQKALEDFKVQNAAAIEGYGQLQSLYTKHDGTDGKPSLTEHMNAYFKDPKPTQTPNESFDPAVDFDPMDAASNPNSPSALYQKQQVAESIREMGITPEFMDSVKALNQEKAQDTQDEKIVEQLMETSKLTFPQAVEVLNGLRNGGEKFVLESLGKLYNNDKADLQTTRDTQDSPPSIAGIQGAAPPEGPSDSDKEWDKLQGGLNVYRE